MCADASGKIEIWEASLVNGWFWFFVHTSVDVAFDFKKLGPLKTRVSRRVQAPCLLDFHQELLK
jgi:hypothetical protein